MRSSCAIVFSFLFFCFVCVWLGVHGVCLLLAWRHLCCTQPESVQVSRVCPQTSSIISLSLSLYFSLSRRFWRCCRASQSHTHTKKNVTPHSRLKALGLCCIFIFLCVCVGNIYTSALFKHHPLRLRLQPSIVGGSCCCCCGCCCCFR